MVWFSWLLLVWTLGTERSEVALLWSGQGFVKDTCCLRSLDWQAAWRSDRSTTYFKVSRWFTISIHWISCLNLAWVIGEWLTAPLADAKDRATLGKTEPDTGRLLKIPGWGIKIFRPSWLCARHRSAWKARMRFFFVQLWSTNEIRCTQMLYLWFLRLMW